MLLIIDNYDSFVFNLARYFEQLGQPTRVVRNDDIDVGDLRRMRPQAIILSPGPCAPERAGCCLDVVSALHGEVPMLGVCLGHQVIAQALGGGVIRSGRPVHGHASPVFHQGHPLFDGINSPFQAGRYHSLVAESRSLPAPLAPIAQTGDGTIMAIAHRRSPVYGVQFHPESVLTEGGYRLLANFLRLAGLSAPAGVPRLEIRPRQRTLAPLPVHAHPLTF